MFQSTLMDLSYFSFFHFPDSSTDEVTNLQSLHSSWSFPLFFVLVTVVDLVYSLHGNLSYMLILLYMFYYYNLLNNDYLIILLVINW